MSTGKADIEKFDGTGDYTLWKEKILAHLELIGLLEALKEEEEEAQKESCATGEASSSTTDDKGEKPKKDAATEEKKRKARSTIILSVSDHVLRKIIKEKTAAGMIKSLDKLYMSQVLPNRIYLKQKLYSYRIPETTSIEQGIDELLKLITDLEHVQVSVPDEDQAVILLMSLPKVFDGLKDTLKYSKDTLTLDDVIGSIHFKQLEIGNSAKQLSSIRTLQTVCL